LLRRRALRARRCRPGTVRSVHLPTGPTSMPPAGHDRARPGGGTHRGEGGPGKAMCSTLPCASARRDGPPIAPRQRAGAPDAVDEEAIDARAEHVAATFELIRARQGTRLEWAGDDVGFTDTATVDRLDGQRRPLCWQDGHAGDLVNAALVDPNVDEDGLT